MRLPAMGIIVGRGTILEGRQAKAMQLEEVMPSEWDEQRGQFFRGLIIPTAARPLSELHARLQL